MGVCKGARAEPERPVAHISMSGAGEFSRC